MLLYILRHGVTLWNKETRVQGSADIPLAEDGILLARKTGEAVKDIPFDLCISSPLVRASRTAREVLGGRDIPMRFDKRLQEIDFGELEGTLFKDSQGRVLDPRMETFFRKPFDFPRPKDGEDIFDVIKRAGEFLSELEEDPSLQDQSILLSTHGCTSRALLWNLCEDSKEYWRQGVPPNCSISIVEVKDGKKTLLAEDKVFTGVITV